MSLVWSAVISSGFHCTLSSDVTTDHLSTKQQWPDLCRGWFELIRDRCRCFRFGGYDRWRLRFWRLWILDYTSLEVLNFRTSLFLGLSIIGCSDFGGYEPWKIWAWRLWKHVFLSFWRFRSLDVSILKFVSFGVYDLGGYGRILYLLFLEVMIVGWFNFGGYELWRLCSWSFWCHRRT